MSMKRRILYAMIASCIVVVPALAEDENNVSRTDLYESVLNVVSNAVMEEIASARQSPAAGRLQELIAELKIETQRQKLELVSSSKARLDVVMNQDLERLKKSVRSVYIRWGHTECSGKAILIYKGQAGGTQYSYVGGGTNALCLPEEPEWNDYQEGLQVNAELFGAEYETLYTIEFVGKHDYDVPCAVCETPRAIVQMFPAKTSCPQGWNKEYGGYLMSGYYRHYAASEYDCVDIEMMIIPGTKVDKNGRLFYFVYSYCGSLDCTKYGQGKQITCVVCSYGVE